MKKKILHIISSLSAGGVESLVVSLYENIDRDKFQFDFAVFNPNNQIHKEKLEGLGANIYFIADAGSKTSLYSKIAWRFKAVFNYIKILRKKKYDAVHCHYYNNFGPYILFAAISNIPVRIVHSHNAGSNNESWKRKLFRKYWNFLNFDFLITHKVACSNYAASWLYGKAQFNNDKIITIYNGIDMSKFSFSSHKKIDMQDKIIQFVTVGRFNIQKNHSFLIDLFFEMSLVKENIFLNIVGLGPFENKLKNQVKSLNLDAKVRFYEFDTNIPQLLRRMDYFLLPSLWEGFPITALEAQAAGLPIFISDTVTKEVDMGLATYLPIDKGPKYWAEKIFQLIDSDAVPRKINPEKQMQFDIRNVAKQFEELYNDNV
jgi:glycosyltransferase EpsF